MLPAALLVIILAILVFLRPVFIGYFALENVSSYTQDIDAVFVENTSYLLELEHGELKSLKLSGSVIGDGSARVYLETDNESYLVFDSNSLEEEGLTGITGYAPRRRLCQLPPIRPHQVQRLASPMSTAMAPKWK